MSNLFREWGKDALSNMDRRSFLAATLKQFLIGSGSLLWLAHQEARGEVVENASTSRTTKEEAIEAIKALPKEEFDTETLEKIEAITTKASIFRRLPTQLFVCDPNMYLFFLNHPDVLVSVWQELGISNITMEQSEEGQFEIKDKSGSRSVLTYLYQSENMHLVHAEGIYEGPLFKRTLKGECLVALKTGFIKRPDGNEYVANRLDAFIRLDRAGAELMLKTFQQIVGKAADDNFQETSTFVSRFSRTAEINAEKVKRLAEKLTAVKPELRRELSDLAVQVAEKAAQRDTDSETASRGKPKGKKTPTATRSALN